MAEESQWTAGTIVFSLIFLGGSVCISGGPCLTQWAEKRKKAGLQTTGMIIFTFGGIFWNMGAMNMPPLLVAPLLTSVLIMNVVFAKYVNSEEPTIYDIVGSCFLAAYMILLVIGQPGDSKFHSLFITRTSADVYNTIDVCAAHDAKLRWMIDETILKWQFFVYLAMCFVAISVLVGLNWYIRYKIARRSEITGTDVDHYRITFSCIGGVFGGSEDIFILFLNPMFAAAFAGCTEEFFKQWLLYVDIVVVVMWFVFQMWWVSRGVVVAGAKLNGSLELISHQFSTLFGIQIGLQGYQSFEDNMFKLPVAVAIAIFVLAVVFGVIGSAILMHGYSVFRKPARMYAISDGGGLHDIGEKVAEVSKEPAGEARGGGAEHTAEIELPDEAEDTPRMTDASPNVVTTVKSI